MVSITPEPPNWSPWSEWSQCDVTIGQGSQQRNRTCLEDECPDGSDCDGDNLEIRDCEGECVPRKGLKMPLRPLSPN